MIGCHQHFSALEAPIIEIIRDEAIRLGNIGSLGAVAVKARKLARSDFYSASAEQLIARPKRELTPLYSDRGQRSFSINAVKSQLGDGHRTLRSDDLQRHLFVEVADLDDGRAFEQLEARFSDHRVEGAHLG